MGAASGMSQSDEPAEDSGMFVFQHPVDVCYETRGEDISSVAMPRLEIELRWRDDLGRSDVGGYAVVHVPSAPGAYELSCRVWRPRGSIGDRIAAFFVGGNPGVKDPKLRYGFEDEASTGDGPGATRLMRAIGRRRLATVPAGEVHLRLNVCAKQGLSGVVAQDALGLGGEE